MYVVSRWSVGSGIFCKILSYVCQKIHSETMYLACNIMIQMITRMKIGTLVPI